jgi:hypothetical protein
MVKDILAAIDAEIACLEQAKALLSASGAVVAKRKPGRPPRLLLLCSEGSESQEAQQDERRGAGAHPAGADQALGCLEERIQSEHERNSCATAQGKEEGRKGCLMDTFSIPDPAAA